MQFKARGYLTTHMRTHDGSKPFKCEFPNCNASFTQSGNLSIHKRYAQEFFPFSAFVLFFDLNHSLSSVHTGERPLQCAHCTETFMFNADRARHMKKEHADLIPVPARPAAAPESAKTDALPAVVTDTPVLAVTTSTTNAGPVAARRGRPAMVSVYRTEPSASQPTLDVVSVTKVSVAAAAAAAAAAAVTSAVTSAATIASNMAAKRKATAADEPAAKQAKVGK
jgi:uncharacterized C2H2 Zn-finger protein